MLLVARASDQPSPGPALSRGHVAPVGGAIALHMACLAALVAMGSAAPPPAPPEERRVEVMISPLPASVVALPAVESVTTTPAEMAPVAALPPPATPPPPEPAATTEPVYTAAPPVVEQPAVRLPPQASARLPARRNVVPLPAPTRHPDEHAPAAAEPQRSTAAPVVVPTPDAEAEARFEARVRDAVQAAVHYPPAARMMGLTGRARVLLDYRGGMVDDPTLAQSSGAPLLDTAALTAAREAHYPKPPPDLENRRFRFLVWVEFRTG